MTAEIALLAKGALFATTPSRLLIGQISRATVSHEHTARRLMIGWSGEGLNDELLLEDV